MSVRFEALSFFLGSALHILLFRRGEWDRHAPKIVAAYILLCTAIFTAFRFSTNFSFITCIVETWKTGLALIVGLFASMLSYRLLLHPLRSIPGPSAARISSFWVFRENWPDLRFYVKLRELHKDYGDFVRIRPRELSICHPDAINDVHGPRNRVLKGEFYEQIYPAHSLQFTRDPHQHKYQRRYWDKAFQTKALQEYTPRIVKHYKMLMRVLSTESAGNTSVDVSRPFMDLFFDVISDLTFGKSFDTLTAGQRNPIIGEFLAYQQTVGFVLLNMWIFHLVRSIPGVAARILYWMRWYSASLDRRKEVRERTNKKRRWYANALEEREKIENISPDLYTYLSQSDTFAVDGIHEAQLAIIAGADTNAITVSNVCYLLCRHPEYQKKLYEELSGLPVHEDIVDDRHLQSKPCLLSIINETLRLYPPVPGGLQRMTPPEGATIAGRYVPGNMIVSTPTYALHRDPRAFVRPDEFIPERWTSEPQLVLRKDAFVPFSYGAYNCAGKPLAMMQLRMVIATVIKKFELAFAPGKEVECERFIQDQADCFTLHLHPLPLVLKSR